LRELELPEAAKVGGGGGVAVGRERRHGVVAGGGVVGWCVGWLMARSSGSCCNTNRAMSLPKHSLGNTNRK
jgi:hypothetical protein